LITQLSVFLENKPGRLSEMARLLQEAGVNIKAMGIAEAGNYGIVRMVVDNVDLAVKALQKAGMAVSKVDILAIDMRAGVYQISKILGDHEINIDYAYTGSGDIIFMKVSDEGKAYQVLKSAGVKVYETI